MEAKLQITLFTAILTAVDSAKIADAAAFRDFHRNFCSGVVQSDPGLAGELSKVLMNMWPVYSRFAASAITSSALDFVNATILEQDSNDLVLSPNALAFLEYRRISTGVAEAYAHFIWEKARFPDVKVYVQALPCVIHSRLSPRVPHSLSMLQ